MAIESLDGLACAMIAFGCSIISPELYLRHAGRGIEFARERSSRVFACQAAGSIFRRLAVAFGQRIQ